MLTIRLAISIALFILGGLISLYGLYLFGRAKLADESFQDYLLQDAGLIMAIGIISGAAGMVYMWFGKK